MPEPRPEPSAGRYWSAVAVTVLAILSQYFLPQLVPALRPAYTSLGGDLAIVYGIPIVAFLLLVGTGPLRGWAGQLGRATWDGLGWYGLLSFVALLVVVGLALVYALVDPSALALLDRTNPVLVTAASNPWAWIVGSFGIGAVEETIFRGWIFGYWARRPGPWWIPGIWTSVLFAGVHLYYDTTYGPAAPLIFPTLFFVGLAFAAGYHYSNGNLVVIALLHGSMDALAFLTILSVPAADALHYALLFVGLAVAIAAWMKWEYSDPRSGPIGALVRWLGAGGPPAG